MHIDFNSCFATIEQQANPLLRGKPIVVAAYATDRGCILAASIEAKRLGIKTKKKKFTLIKPKKKKASRKVSLYGEPLRFKEPKFQEPKFRF